MSIGKRWVEIFDGEIKPLDSELEIEELLIFINKMDTEIDFYNRLKQKRVNDIDEQIEKLDEKKKILKDVIIATLNAFKNKSLKFPGIGKVNLKNKPGKWVIEGDTNLVIDELRKILSPDECCRVIGSKEFLVKAELDQVLDNLVAKGQQVMFANKEEDTTSLTISTDKDIENLVSTKEFTTEDYDSLEF